MRSDSCARALAVLLAAGEMARRRAIARWSLALLLLRNPALRHERRHGGKDDKTQLHFSSGADLRSAVMDMPGRAAAALWD